MAYPKKKAAKKTVSSKKRKAPAKKLSDEEVIVENMSSFLWTFCGLGGSLKVLEVYEAVRDAYQRLKPPAKQELRVIAAQVVAELTKVHGLIRRERHESGTTKP